MSETEFLIGRNGLDLQDDFYPDDLPHEWRFDYYCNMFRTLLLPIDTEEDLDMVFEDLEEVEGDFELVLSIQADQLLDAATLASLLRSVADYKDQFILFCELDQLPDEAILQQLSGYRLCFQSTKPLDLALDHQSVADYQLYYNDLPVLYSSNPWNETQMRAYLERAAQINQKTILICKYAEAETLSKMRVISEVLGF